MAIKRERISRKEAEVPETRGTESTPASEREGRLRPKYARLGAFGLLMAGLGPLIILVAIAATEGLGEDLGFFGALSAIGLLGAGLSWRFGTWSKIVGIVASLAVGFGLFWSVFLLAALSSPIEFAVGLLVPAGVLLGLGGHIAALVQKRRGNVSAEAPRVERRAIQGVGAVVVLGVLVSAVLYMGARESVDPAAAAGAEVVSMKNFEFDPATLEIPAGESTKILVHNNDVVTHTFTVPELDIDERIVPGSEVLVEVDAPEGTFVVYCEPHSDTSDPDPEDDMVMRLAAR